MAEPDVAALPEALQAVHADFKNSQVKTLSFLTYLMRVNGPLVLTHKVCFTYTLKICCLLLWLAGFASMRDSILLVRVSSNADLV